MFECFEAPVFSVPSTQDDEITRLTQLSELQREEIIDVCLDLPILLALVSFTSLSTQLRSEIDELDAINHEAEEQVIWLYQSLNPHFIYPLTLAL